MDKDLINTLKCISAIPKDEEKKLLSITTERYFNKGELYLREEQVPKSFSFVVKGLFRYFYMDKRGYEYTKEFVAEGGFLASYSAMKLIEGSYFNIEALEDAFIIEIPFAKWQDLLLGHDCWKNVTISILEKEFGKTEKKERELLLSSAEERYLSFLEDYPAMEGRIKQHQLASYLGITPIALSKIRKSMTSLT